MHKFLTFFFILRLKTAKVCAQKHKQKITEHVEQYKFFSINVLLNAFFVRD